jgi:hypothetical protein
MRLPGTIGISPVVVVRGAILGVAAGRDWIAGTGGGEAGIASGLEVSAVDAAAAGANGVAERAGSADWAWLVGDASESSAETAWSLSAGREPDDICILLNGLRG